MKYFFALCTALTVLLIFSCSDDQTDPVGTSSIELAFTANYGGEPLIIDEGEYDYNGNAIRFKRVNFYLSNMTLGKAESNTAETELSEIRFIDLTPTHLTEETAAIGTKLNFSKIPVDEYNSISFGIGVAPDLNKTKPSDYATTHPLGTNNSGEYWAAWDSYIFVKIEGQYDVDGDGFDADDVSFAYHVGEDEMYRLLTANFENPVQLEADVPMNIQFNLDVKELLTKNDGSLLELSVHDPSHQAEEMRLIMDNFFDAMRFRL